MTTVINKTLKRKTSTTHHGKPIVVSIAPGDVIGFRLERSRKTYWSTIAACMDMAIKQEVAAAKYRKSQQRRKS